LSVLPETEPDRRFTIPLGSNTTGLLHAQEMLARHQEVLANLVLLHPDNQGLKRAYNNSLLLEQKFGDKTEMRFTRVTEKNNKSVFKAVRLEIRNPDYFRNNTTTSVNNIGKDKDTTREKIKDQKDLIPANGTITLQDGSRNDTPANTKTPQEDKGSSQNKGKNGHD
jgi:hypothetical protein